MQIEWVDISSIQQHEDNPRIIDTHKFNTLVDSISEFPEMLQARPIITDLSGVILCGNMRYLACKELGMQSVPIKRVDLPEDKVAELMVKDNLAYGDWDYEVLEKEWDMNLYDKWMGNQRIDYSVLDDYEDIRDKVEDMYDGVRKAIQIQVATDDYQEAKELEKQCRESGIYIGGCFLDLMRTIKKEYE